MLLCRWVLDYFICLVFLAGSHETCQDDPNNLEEEEKEGGVQVNMNSVSHHRVWVYSTVEPLNKGHFGGNNFYL